MNPQSFWICGFFFCNTHLILGCPYSASHQVLWLSAYRIRPTENQFSITQGNEGVRCPISEIQLTIDADCIYFFCVPFDLFHLKREHEKSQRKSDAGRRSGWGSYNACINALQSDLRGVWQKPLPSRHLKQRGRASVASKSSHAFIPCWNEADAKRIRSALQHPTIPALLKQLNGKGKCNWAQPGKIKQILDLEKPTCDQPQLPLLQ